MRITTEKRLERLEGGTEAGIRYVTLSTLPKDDRCEREYVTEAEWGEELQLMAKPPMTEEEWEAYCCSLERRP